MQGVHTGARERLRQPACSRDEKLREVGDIAWQGAKNSGRVPRIAAGVRELAWTCWLLPLLIGSPQNNPAHTLVLPQKHAIHRP